MRNVRNWITGTLIFVTVYAFTFVTVAWAMAAPQIAVVTSFAAASAATGLAFTARNDDK
jgi:hypothetical protein